MRQVENECGYPLLPAQAKFSTLLHRLAGIPASVSEGHHIGARGLRLQKERREIRRVDRMTDRTKHLAAAGYDRFGAILFEVLSECIVGREKKPRLPAFGRHGFAETVAKRVCIVSPVHEIL